MIGTIGLFPVLLNITDYNVNRHFRTLLNYLEVSALHHALIGLTLIELIEILRMIWGPLHHSICWFQIFIRNGPFNGAILHINVNVFFRVSFTKRKSFF